MLGKQFWLQGGVVNAVSPSDQTGQLKDSVIIYGFLMTSFGRCFAALSEQGLCWLEPVTSERVPQRFRKAWSAANLTRDDRALADRLDEFSAREKMPLHLRGTTFQLEVWSALLATEPGQTLFYSGLARLIGKPDSARAVGAAVGANSIAFFVPCHRVLPASGGIGNYRWGPKLKWRVLVAEAEPDHTLAA